jgi:hypothetical protein
VTDLHDQKHKLREETNMWAKLSVDHYHMQNDTYTLIDLLWKDRQLLQNQCNNLCNDLARIIKKRMKDANWVAHNDLPLAFNMVDELESYLDSAVANNKALLKQLQDCKLGILSSYLLTSTCLLSGYLSNSGLMFELEGT